MSFSSYINKLKSIDFEKLTDNVTEDEICFSLNRENLHIEDFINLISPLAVNYLEEMALKAHQKTIQYFGRTIQLYTPLYIANYCENQCIYCGFNAGNKITRKKLTLDEIEKEASFLSEQGFQHLLILTGSSRRKTPVSYISKAVKLLRSYFPSVSLEVFALTSDEYRELVDAGADGLTIYQEVYNEDVYKKVHLRGPKTNYQLRIDAPDRAAGQGMRQLNIGALLGLTNWRKEAFFLAGHADYLQRTYPETELGVSVPRLRPHAGSYEAADIVSDRDIVQFVTALRLFLPRVGITLSTREDSSFRDNIFPLGITRMSAGSTTAVGGHTQARESTSQFDIADERSLKDIIKMLKNKNFQPVTHDWVRI